MAVRRGGAFFAHQRCWSRFSARLLKCDRGRIEVVKRQPAEQQQQMIGRTEHLENLLAPTVEAMGFEIWGVEQASNGRTVKLRVYIDSDHGVTVDDCQSVSDQIEGFLDAEEALTDVTALEVSSPGLDRILFKQEQLQASVGETLDLRLQWPLEGSSHIRGELRRVADTGIWIVHEGVEKQIELTQVHRARIVPQFS